MSSRDQQKNGIIKNDLKKLNAFVKSMHTQMGLDVGIMGNKTGRQGKGVTTNAEIGFVHEFGSITRGIPKRSFLRMPLFVHSEKILERVVKAGAMKKLSEGHPEQVLDDLGVSCEVAIADAFDTGGFGSWKELKPGTVSRKHSAAILIQTGQLRRSIAHAVTQK